MSDIIEVIKILLYIILGAFAFRCLIGIFLDDKGEPTKAGAVLTMLISALVVLATVSPVAYVIYGAVSGILTGMSK